MISEKKKYLRTFKLGLGTWLDMRTLAGLVRALSYREGDFTLSSGAKSPFYIDLKATTLHPVGIQTIAETAVKKLQALGWLERIQAIGGLTLGADPLATAISLEALKSGRQWPAFIVRKEAKGHGTGQFIEGQVNIPDRASVLVLEDVTTTGSSAKTAIDRVKEMGWSCAGVLTVVDRQQGAEKIFNASGVPFASLLTLEDIQKAVPR